MSTYRVIVHTTTGKLTAVAHATHDQALASIRMFMRADGYPAAVLVDEHTDREVKVYINKHTINKKDNQ